MASFKQQFKFSVRIANFVLIPSFIGLAVLGYPIIQALFERGQFTNQFSHLTYQALLPYAAGLPAYSMIKIFASAFYARKNTKTPMRIAVWAMIVNIVMNFVLMFKFGVGGLAAATTLSAWFQAAFLYQYLRKEMGPLGGRDVMKSYISSTGIGLFMGFVCWLLAFHLLKDVNIYLNVFVSISIGTGLYFVLSKILKIKEFDVFLDTIKRKTK